MTAGTCTIGATVGTVTVTNPAQVVFGQAGSATSNTAFLVSSGGVITLARALTPGTYTVQVTATNPFGTTQIPVTINAGCSGGSGGTSGGSGAGTGGTTVPGFLSPSYTFAPTGTTCQTGATIGSVAVSGTSGSPSYVITPSNPAFAISGTGAITLTGSPGLTSGTTYTFSVTAANGIGEFRVSTSLDMLQIFKWIICYSQVSFESACWLKGVTGM